MNGLLPLDEPASAKKARMLATIDRELKLRREVYAYRVAEKKMTQAFADKQIAAMQEVRDFIAEQA
jgi:hypothetical protein